MSIQEEEIVINAQDLQITDNSIKLIWKASTNTVPSLDNLSSFEIALINKPPIVKYSGDTPIFITDNNIVSKILFIVVSEMIFWILNIYLS